MQWTSWASEQVLISVRWDTVVGVTVVGMVVGVADMIAEVVVQ